MRVLLIAVLLVSLAVPAYARGKRDAGASQAQNTGEQQKKSREEEKAYKDAQPDSGSEAGRSLGQGALARAATAPSPD
jgi:hypothetical protein